jgi:5-formyltetrahydrofolate cyclo-ligase
LDLSSESKSDSSKSSTTKADADEIPREDASETDDLDLVLMPAVSFDRQLRRLGHGKGYYDHYLNTLIARRKQLNKPLPTLVGLSLEEQIVEEVPTLEHDVTLNYVVTPSAILTPPKESSSSSSNK